MPTRLRLSVCTERWKRTRKPISVIMLDIDHFKRVNDLHGHPVGDRVIQAVAQRCKETLREVDIFGRYGGEEFAVMMPDSAGNEAAKVVAERIRTRVSHPPLKTDRGELRVTVSLGVVTSTDTISNLDALLARADEALYQSKQGGRDRVTVAKQQ